MSMRMIATIAGAALMSSAFVAAGPVLIVNGRNVGRAEMLVAEHGFEAQARSTVDKSEMMKHVADQLIAQALLVQAAEQAKVAVSDEEVAQSLKEKREKLGARQADFEKAMKEQGITEADLVRIERENLLVRRYIQTTIAPQAKVSEADAKAFYDANPKEFQHPQQFKLRMMMFRVPGIDSASVAAAKKRAEKALARVKAGEDFSAVATDVTDDSASKPYGGLVGWVQTSLLAPDLSTVVDSLKAGETSAVVRNRDAFYVLHVDEIRGPGLYDYSEVRAQLPRVLEQRKLRQSLAELLKTQRDAATIEVVDPELKAALGNGGSHAGGQPTPVPQTK